MAEIDQKPQYPRDDLDAYVKRSYKKTLDCSDLVVEDLLVDICFHEIIEKSDIVGGFAFSSFSYLMEATI